MDIRANKRGDARDAIKLPPLQAMTTAPGLKTAQNASPSVPARDVPTLSRGHLTSICGNLLHLHLIRVNTRRDASLATTSPFLDQEQNTLGGAGNSAEQETVRLGSVRAVVQSKKSRAGILRINVSRCHQAGDSTTEAAR